MNSRAKKTALRAMLVALAFVLAWLESQIPALIAVPGVKLGLTNLVVLVALYKLSWPDALCINFIRILLVGLTFGNLFSLWYSLAGGLLSTLGMILLKQVFHANVVTVSITGGLLHNLGQILVAVLILDSPSLFYYLVVLWIAGSLAGLVVGLLGVPIIQRLRFSDRD